MGEFFDKIQIFPDADIAVCGKWFSQSRASVAITSMATSLWTKI